MYLTVRKLARNRRRSPFVAAGLAGCDIAVDGDGGLSLRRRARKAQDEWTRSYKVAPGGRLELINVNGRITAEASDGDTRRSPGRAHAPRRSSDERARELLGKIEMREEVGDARVRVEVRAPRCSGASGHEIKWTIKVPQGRGRRPADGQRRRQDDRPRRATFAPVAPTAASPAPG